MTTPRRWFRPAVALGLGLAWGPGRVRGSGVRSRTIPRPRGAEPAAEGLPTSVERDPYDPQQVEGTVSFWEGRARRSPRGPRSPRAGRRVSGPPARVRRHPGRRAGRAGRPRVLERSWARQRRGAEPAGPSLLAQHRFPEVLDVAKQAAAIDPRPIA
ncbi:MAG: hypothetical protein WKF75_15305 [Singulisphaera sp.]